MKEGWTYKKLGELCYISTGKHDANHAKEEGAYRFYTCASQYVYCDTFSFDGDCLILPGNGANVGEVYKFSGKFDAYQRTYVLSNIKKEEISFGYLYYYFLGNWKKQGSAKQYGAATNYIIMGNFTGFTIKYPVLSEQKRIVERLDAAFENIDKLKANAETQLAEARTLFQKCLAKAMEPKEGWEEKKLGDVCKSVNYGTSLPSSENGKYKYLRMNNITIDGTLDLANLKTINIPEKDFEKCVVRKGDLLFNRTNSPELVGKTCIFEEDEEMIIAGYIIRIRFNDSIYPKFASYYINLQRQLGNLRPLIVGAVHQANISAKAIQSINFQFPSIEQQQRIVERLDALSENIRKYEEIQRQIISECDALKQALLRKVFE